MASIQAVDRPAAIGPAASAGTQRLPRAPGAGWLYLYLAIEIGCQLALLVPALAPGRVLIRSAAIGTSLLLLALIPGRPLVRPGVRYAAGTVIGILALEALNPGGSTPLAVLAHFCFYLAVIAPLFWASRLDIDDRTLGRMLLVIWTYSTLSAVFGVLQVYFPGRFQPALSVMLKDPSRMLYIELASGERVLRPMGLTDMPGGAAWGATWAVLLGFGVMTTRPFPFARLLALVSMTAGAICLYLCQVRVLFLITAGNLGILIALFAFSKRISRLVGALATVAVIAAVGFYAAFALAGDTVTSRLATLVEADPITVYYGNRGHYIEAAFFEVLPEYPLGAGLGRWGMMNQYFGEIEDLIWAEVQWTGWIIDGGIFLVIAYPVAVISLLVAVARVALAHQTSPHGVWAAIAFAYGVGVLALSFGGGVFMSTAGTQFWLLGTVALVAGRRPPPRPS